MEKRENKSLIQSVCTKALDIPVRIECEIDEHTAADSTTPRTDDAGAEMAGDGGRTDNAGTEMAGGIDRADTAGAGLDEYPGSAEELVTEAQDTTSAGNTGGQAANTRAGAAKDPAVMKIVKAFDGQIVTD